ncbi:MAG: YgiT-type zinc finger protein [Candidatus Desantisbacteria bacterium]
MKCVICHGDEIRVVDIREEFMVDNDIVYVPVKIPVCQNCGERYYDRRTMQFIEKIERELSKKKEGLKEVGRVLVYA